MHRSSLPLIVLVFALGCDGSPYTGDDGGFVDAGPPPPMDAGPPIPDVSARPVLAAANAVAPGDARFVGQQRFLWDTWGLELQDEWPPVEFILQVMEDEPEVFGDQLAAFGFLPDPDDDLPVGLKRGVLDPTRVHGTCSLCHTGRLPDGQLWLGYPNRELELGRFQIELDDRWVAAGNPSLLDATTRSRLERHGPGRIGSETSSSADVIPVEHPPIYDLDERVNLNYGGSGHDVRSETYLSLFGSGAGFPNPREAVVPFPQESRLAEFLTFFGSIAPPPAPAGDAAAIARGALVFESAGCASCHHVGDLGADRIVTLIMDGAESLPDDTHPTGTIRTDPGRTALQEGDTGFAVYFTFIREHDLNVGPTDGYRPSDLRGVWASAPFLHNGAVPTLEALLDPPSRPATFERGTFTVDTTTTGNSNGGHEFGAELADTDRADLVAYLNSL